jgi:hypothetical protein
MVGYLSPPTVAATPEPPALRRFTCVAHIERTPRIKVGAAHGRKRNVVSVNTQLNDDEIDIIDISRDFPAFYDNLDLKHKVIFQVWMRTADLSLAAHLFPGFASEPAAKPLKIATPSGCNCFAFVGA